MNLFYDRGITHGAGNCLAGDQEFKLTSWSPARGRLRQAQNLPRLDLVRIGELILVQLEDLHVGARVAEMILGDLA
jgi:hypothetical protein